MNVSGIGGGMDKGEGTDDLDRVVKRRSPQECELLESHRPVCLETPSIDFKKQFSSLQLLSPF